MKILNASQIRDLDRYTIENTPISSLELMEKAAMAFTDCFTKIFSSAHKVTIFCGMGNNGGDGLAIARLLKERGYSIEIAIVQHSINPTEDFKKNLDRLQGLLQVKVIKNVEDLDDIGTTSLTIDALLGSGLNREPEGILADAIHFLNENSYSIVSVDIASGLVADALTNWDTIVRPQYTIAFEVPKLAFFIPQNQNYVGSWQIPPIGLSKKFIDEAESDYTLIQKNLILSIYQKRQRFAHKGTFGKALLSVGSLGKVGAAVLSATSCLKSGVGLLTVHAPKIAYNILQTAIPEAMVIPDQGTDYLEDFPETQDYQAIGVGSGWDKKESTFNAFKKCLKNYRKPMVVDADALNLLAENPEMLREIPKNSIFSPHFKEFERLTEKPKNDFHRIELLQTFSRKYEIVVILKGQHTIIATPDGKLFFNNTGNPGMATAGSGDVLTGILTSLLAQGYEPYKAACVGVYIHGLAGDYAAKAMSQESMIASDIIGFLGEVFLELNDGGLLLP